SSRDNCGRRACESLSKAPSSDHARSPCAGGGGFLLASPRRGRASSGFDGAVVRRGTFWRRSASQDQCSENLGAASTACRFAGRFPCRFHVAVAQRTIRHHAADFGKAAGARRRAPMSVLLGASGWSYDDWVGPFYPPGTVPRDYLAHYPKRFGAVEIDSTFYAIPALATVQGWADRTPEGFLF